MKLYYASRAPAGQRWTGTQADDKAVRKQFGGDMFQREVPVSKPELIQFLNAEEAKVPEAGPIEGPISTHGRPPDELEQAELRAVAADQHPPEPPFNTSWEASDIESFILSRATVAQVETIFATLGTRFKELSNAS